MSTSCLNKKIKNKNQPQLIATIIHCPPISDIIMSNGVSLHTLNKRIAAKRCATNYSVRDSIYRHDHNARKLCIITIDTVNILYSQYTLCLYYNKTCDMRERVMALYYCMLLLHCMHLQMISICTCIELLLNVLIIYLWLNLNVNGNSDGCMRFYHQHRWSKQARINMQHKYDTVIWHVFRFVCIALFTTKR